MRVGIDLLSERGTPGGIHTYTNEVIANVASLAERHAEIDLELVLFAHKDYEFLFPAEETPRIQVVRSRWSGLPAVPRRLFQEAAGPRLARQYQVDLLHSINNVLPRRLTVPGVVTVHDLSAFTVPGRFSAWKQRYLCRRIPESVRRSTRVITVSRSTRSDILTWIPGVQADRIVVAPLATGARFTDVGSEEEERTIRSRHGLPEGFLLHVSIIERGKNLEAVSHALSMLKERQVIIPLVVAGSPTSYLSELRSLWKELRITDQVHYLGSVPFPELPHLYRMAKAFVFPSHYEGFGLPLLEAFACGTPAIASTRSSLPEVAGNAALLVPPRRPEALVDAIHKIWSDEGLRALLRARGLARAKDFSWERTSLAHCKVYLEAHGGPCHLPSLQQIRDCSLAPL